MPKAKAKARPAPKKRGKSRRSSVQLSATVARRSPKKAELKYVPWNTVDLEDLNPLLQRQFVVGHDIMVARVLLKKGCIVPEHSHHNEQFTYILEGALKFWIDGREIVVRAGEVLTIPRNMPHKAEALEDTVDLDVFHPPRADWINKTDQYLRHHK
jgi:quercetin dioxygenase-like cupin family protein